ncbi:hypothetical protein HYC85_008186 [Camellia sinensis]|uniref:Glycosyl hydrolase family 13 catalytic domain-containing protein n=1 Tax=Camellia sinensis TaxID=4442 RepID=A0A7J7HR45_CAMSI|nr:hypothetical protein HYC85_008186 [Camellia sinensis]
MDALLSPQQGTKMLHSPLCDSSIKSSSFALAVSRNVHHSFITSYRSSLMGLKLSRRRQSNKTEQRVFSKVRQGGRGKHKTANVYGRRTEERVLEEEAPEMLESGPLFRVFPGQAYPLGVSELESGINFAIFSQHATAVTLCLSLPDREEHDKPDGGMVELRLDPHMNKTGDIWHICVEDLPRSDVLYSYRMDGPRGWHQGHRYDDNIILIDPYAKLIEGRRFFGDASHKMAKFFGTYDFNSLPFSWGENYKLPNIPEKDLVIYEMNVRAFTADESSGLNPSIRGSYLGVIEKIPHLLELGINAVELLPVFEFDEFEFQRRPNPRDHMVILDVVYNHTNEADDDNPYTTSFRGIDNKVYYMVDLNNNGQLLNFAGLWVVDYHVDGFRFDLASVLCRGTDGSPLSAPPIIRAIAKDSILSRCKIIAEPWDCGGLYLVGRFPNWDRWAEWNGKYRDDIRKFIKGDAGMKGSFATRVAGSADLYRVNKRKPYHSINFVIAHDGFTLYDLVSYNFKHNDANGEGGNDGSNDNFSWNCGYEGKTTDTNIKALRFRQMKNFHLALMISQGTPMMLMGDEYGHTRYGNNNSYGHDTAMNHFQWGQVCDIFYFIPITFIQLEARKNDHMKFFSEMIKFRKSRHVFRRENFIGQNEVTWHESQWDNSESKFLAITFHDKNGGDIYLAFNAHSYFIEVALPSPPQKRHWFRVVDTNLESPHDFVSEGAPGIRKRYNVAPYSSILLEAKP